MRKSDESTGYRGSVRDNRSLSTSAYQYGQKLAGPTIVPVNMPGSFSTELKGGVSSGRSTPQHDIASIQFGRPGLISRESDSTKTSEQRQAVVREQIAKEMKIKLGTENMLEALLAKNPKQTKDQRHKVEHELGSSNRKLAELRLQLDQEILRAQQSPVTPPSTRMSSYFRGSPMKSPYPQSPHAEEPGEETESPTVVLTDTLQALESDGMQPDYYIDRANILVDLFKRYPTLKYDLAWSRFSTRVQLMLLSESTDVIAAGYRLTRHAITDRASLQSIRRLHTDEILILSLAKKGKALREREQAIKFVRAFLDVKDGVQEIALAVVRGIVAVAESYEDNLRDVCMLTLAELLTKHPSLLVSAGGMSTLTEALASGSFSAPEGLVSSFLHIIDHPKQRRFLATGREFEAMFAPFTDPHLLNGNENKLKACAKAIAAMLKTWPGFLVLAVRSGSVLRSLIDSLQYPSSTTRDIILELLFDVLRIKPPSWSNTYLAGRRLTTYGRSQAHFFEQENKRQLEFDPEARSDLTTHFSAFVLAAFVRAGLVNALSELMRVEEDLSLKRKTTLLLAEVLKLANHCLPRHFSASLQVLGSLVSPIKLLGSEIYATNVGMVYQIESVSRTLNRTSGGPHGRMHVGDELAVGPQAMGRSRLSAFMDPDQFRQAILDTQVTNTIQYVKWKWDLIQGLIEGPLTNMRRLDEAIRATKFLKRLVGFYRPFKYRFSMIRNTRPNQRYVRIGCALIRTLLQTSVGVQYLLENKLLRQIAECLAQVDRYSGLTSTSPLFDRHQMAETLSGGYFALLGALSHTPEGIHIMERWHMMNMFYHIVELQNRDDLIKVLLSNMDFTLDTHLRVILSQALTSATKDVRLFATKLLRRYAVGRVQYSSGLQDPNSSHWALRLVLTQLYDPDIEVSEIAVRILEEACNQRSHLEYVVKCRPSLDHLGEIGAPLLLRFLSTSIGYRYLSGLDYITQEMDDWFLGRNDAYVAMVEASLARAYMDPSIQKSIGSEEIIDMGDNGIAPPHFYRELARTHEGCRLLRQSGHFSEFVSTIRDFELDEEDYEALTKAKGALWAVGNIGSMDLGAPFLEEDDVVTLIVRIAEGAEVLSMRGTACFTLGLISRTTHGLEMLAENGWDTTIDSHGHSLGLCVPTTLERLCLEIQPSNILHNSTSNLQHRKLVPNKRDGGSEEETDNEHDPVRNKIVGLIVEMGNSVMYKKAAGELHAYKNRHPKRFAETALFRKALSILEGHHYRLQARQFILDQFDRGVLRRIVLEEDQEDESPSDDG